MSAVRVIKSGGMFFDGRSGYVRIPASSLLYPDDFTVMAWVNIIATSLSFLGVIDAGRTYNKNWWVVLGAYATPRLQFGVQGTEGFREIWFPIVRTGEWHHYVMIKRGGTIEGYLNGRLIGQASIPGSYVKDTTQPITIGCRNDLMFFSNVIVSDVRIFNRPLSASEILLIYQRGEAIRDGLVLWYTFHEGQGDVVHDMSGNNLHGRRAGGAYWMVKPSVRQLASSRVLIKVR